MIKKSVPHFFTSLNLLSGCFSIYFAYIFQFETAFIFLMAGVFFDVWDGLFARLLKVESELGVQLDSMADMVTCGVAPGIILAQLFVMAGNKPVGNSRRLATQRSSRIYSVGIYRFFNSLGGCFSIGSIQY